MKSSVQITSRSSSVVFLSFAGSIFASIAARRWR